MKGLDGENVFFIKNLELTLHRYVVVRFISFFVNTYTALIS
jgi:hypothetical protein